MKKINWTKEMLEDLKGTESISEFAKKYEMSYNSASNKRKSLLESETKVEVVEIKEMENIEKEFNLEEKLEEVNATTISIIPSIILNIDNLIDKGTKFYLAEVMNNVSTLDKSVSDVEHILERQHRSLDSETLATLSRNIGILREKRRLYKNEYDFLDKNRVNCDSFIKFIKEIRSYSQKVCDKKYSTRVLKEELGKVHIVNENNSELQKLRGMVKQLEQENNILKENLSNAPTDSSYIDRVLKLEKLRLKQERRIGREKGEVVYIDVLEPNWKDSFNAMDADTKKGMLKDCYDAFNAGSYIKEKTIADYIVWNEILPKYLYDKKYFIKK